MGADCRIASPATPRLWTQQNHRGAYGRRGHDGGQGSHFIRATVRAAARMQSAVGGWVGSESSERAAAHVPAI